jgi:hypothetical protein
VEVLLQFVHHGGVLHGDIDLIVEQQESAFQITGADVCPDTVNHVHLGMYFGLLILEDPYSGFEHSFVRAVAGLARELLVLVRAAGEDAPSTPQFPASHSASTKVRRGAKKAVITHSRSLAPTMAAQSISSSPRVPLVDTVRAI